MRRWYSSPVYVSFLTPPRTLLGALILGWRLVLAGRCCRREDHQLVLGWRDGEIRGREWWDLVLRRGEGETERLDTEIHS